MTILVAGASGMLGHKLFQTLQCRNADPLGSIRGRRGDEPYRSIPLLQSNSIIEGFDALDLGAVRDQLRSLRPQVVVNCVGVVKQRSTAHEPVPTIAINALFPHVLAETCAEWGGRLIHVSTDCVFSGMKGQYRESDPTDATDLYGRSKALGEPTAPNTLTLRTSIIGRELEHRASLLEWLLAQDKGSVKGFSRAIYSGVTTNHLAALIATIIERFPSLTGLYHVAAEPISKHRLLLQLRDAYDLDIEITPDETLACDRSLIGEKLAAAIGYHPPSWPELVAELASDPTPYAQWR